MKRTHSQFALATLALFIVATIGCGKKDDRPNVDLDKVLAATLKTLKQPIPKAIAPPKDGKINTQDITPSSGTKGTTRVTATGVDTNKKMTPQQKLAFLKMLADNLNAAKPMMKKDDKTHLGARFDATGAIIGFADANKDMKKDAKEKDLFKVQIDTKKQRLVATDLEDKTINRDSSYRGHRGGGGFFFAYALGSMRSSQAGYYRGGAPKFSSKMAPKGYARNKSYRSPASKMRARSSSGSRSFKGGK